MLKIFSGYHDQNQTEIRCRARNTRNAVTPITIPNQYEQSLKMRATARPSAALKPLSTKAPTSAASMPPSPPGVGVTVAATIPKVKTTNAVVKLVEKPRA